MKIIRQSNEGSLPSFKKIWLIMKLNFLLILLTVLQVSASVSAQNTRLDLKMKNATISQIFDEIERQSEVYFFYNKSQIDENRTISVDYRNKTIDEILKAIVSDLNLTYEFAGKNIIIKSVNPESNGTQQSGVKVKGTAKSATGESLPGVTVLVKGTTDGTITDADGKYMLTNVPSNGTLIFSFVGMKKIEVAVTGKSTIDAVLEDETIGIEEVVAVGYGTMKKSDITGSVSSVKTEALETVPVYSMEQALKIGAAGVRVLQNSGQPGARIEVRIRGGNSMIGSNEPLYVVDGFPVTGGISYLNPSDIESVDILKDASATAIYGSRGANGVVIITSKRGKAGQKGKIEINSLYGIQREINRDEVLDAKQYATIVNERLKNDGQQPYFNVNEIQNPGTNWQDAIFRIAPTQNHTITFSGSSEKTKFSLSGNYYDQKGIIINSGVKRGSFRLNLDHEMNSWLKMSVNLTVSRREQNTVPVDNGNYGSTILSAASSAAPTLPLYDENGTPTKVGQAYAWGESTMENPLIYSGLYKNSSLTNSVIGNTTFDIQLLKDLKFKTLLGLEYGNSLSEQFTPKIYNNDRGYAFNGNSYGNSFLNENVLTYSKKINDKNSINLIGGFTYQTDMSRYANIGVSGFANNTTEDYNLSAGETINPPTSGISEWTLLSWLGRANYSLNNKYLFTASIRADGSSRFGKANKWGMFPSGAFAWRVSEEPFMKELSFISDLKFRASYGITGNTALSPYQSLDRMTTVKYIYGNQTDRIGFSPSGISNGDLKWETTAQMDIGIDLAIIANRFRFTLDYYKKNTNDLLASVPLPPSVGFGSILKNIGEIENHGIELSLIADILKKEFKWDIAAQVSTNRNKVIKLAGNNDIYSDELNLFRSSMNVARVGQPFGSIYGLKEDGLDANGYIKYVDTNKDGVINTLDKVIIGNPYPDFVFGLNSNFSYKHFELNLSFEGVYGNDIFWATAGTNLNSFQRGNNQFVDLIGNYWTAENPNPNAKYPKISSKSLVDVSDRFIEDGSYLRLKSLKLAYNLPVKNIGMTWFDGAQIYLSGTNLFTITNYPGIDPDTNTTGSDSQSVGSRLRVGIDQSAYPAAKMYAIGLKLNF
jgi:TonB-dependent starch-binding outer membrane protein SusC